MRIVSGHPDMFNHLAFGVPTQRVANFLESQFNNMSATLSEAGQAFMERSRAVFERFHGAESMRLAKAAMRTVQHMFDPDDVHFLGTISAMQQANLKMQRWVMACPEIRDLYHQQRCDGYSITYVDTEPGFVGKEHTDWRIVNNGFVHELPEDHESGADWMYHAFYEDQPEEQDRLSVAQREAILDTWAFAAGRMKPGNEDLTSPFADRL